MHKNTKIMITAFSVLAFSALCIGFILMDKAEDQFVKPTPFVIGDFITTKQSVVMLNPDYYDADHTNIILGSNYPVFVSSNFDHLFCKEATYHESLFDEGDMICSIRFDKNERTYEGWILQSEIEEWHQP